MKQAAAYQDWKDDQGNALAATVVQGAGTITRRALTLTLTNGTRFDKTYDGKANVTKTLAKGTDNLLSA